MNKSNFREITKKVKFETFPYALTVIVSNDVQESRKKRNILLGDSRIGLAAAIHVSTRQGQSYIFLDYEASAGVIAHESNHCVWAIMKHIGAKHEEEVMSYLLYYIVEEIMKIVKKF